MKPTVQEVLPLVQEIYGRDGVGCCLHIVLDDANVDADDVQWCLDYAKERGHADCERLATLLLEMSKMQRLRLGRHPAKYDLDPTMPKARTGGEDVSA